MIEFLCQGKKGKTFHYMARREDVLEVEELPTGNASITLNWRFFGYRHRSALITAESYEDVKKRIEQAYPLKYIEKN